LHDSRGDDLLIDIARIGVPKDRVQPAGRQDAGQNLYPVRITQSFVFLGPAAHPESPCPACLERRVVALSPVPGRRALETSGEGMVFGLNPKLTSFALEAVYQLLRAALTKAEPSPEADKRLAGFFALNLDSLCATKHLIVADSLCPVCSKRKPDSPD